MHISYFLSFFCPLILASIDDSCLWSALPCYYGIYQMVIFLFVCFHYSSYIISKSYPFSLFGQLLISIYGLCSISIVIFLLIPRLAIKNFFMSDPMSFVTLIRVIFQGIYFLATQDIPHLSCTFHTPALASVISPRSSGSFY